MSVQSVMTALANSIRAKSGVTGQLSLESMKTAVDGIQTGSAVKLDGEDMSYLLLKGEHRLQLFPYIDMSACDNSTYFMSECKLDENMQPLTLIDVRPLKLEGTNIDNANYMFNACNNCNTLILPESEWNCRATNYMFGGFPGSKVTNIELLGDDTGSNANCDHRNMFRGSSITEVDLSGFTCRTSSANMWQNCVYQCNNLRKVWIPSTCININATTPSYAMFNAAPPSCVVFTDAPSKPSTWLGYWDNYNSTSKIEVRYGSTHAEYEAY